MSLSILDAHLQFKPGLCGRKSTDWIVLHHAGVAKCSVESVHNYHLSLGWLGIGYHFYVRKDGSCYYGRPSWAAGAHCKGKNFQSIGVCCEGDFRTEFMGRAQFRALVLLLDMLFGMFPEAELTLHRELCPTTCPGPRFPIGTVK